MPLIIYWHDCIDKEIKAQNYKLIITLNEYIPESMLFNYYCKKYDISTCFVPHVGVPQDGLDNFIYKSDVIYVEGELDKNFLIENNVDPEIIKVRGSPKYEPLFNKKIRKLKNITDHFTKEITSLSQDKTKILLTTNPISSKSNIIYLTSIIKVVKKLKNIQLIIKLHPRETGKTQRKIIRALKYDAIIIKDIDIFEIIRSSDILLTQESATILDSMVIGTPLICLDFINKRVRFAGKYVYNNDKYIIKAYNENDLFNVLNDFINNPEKLIEYSIRLKKNLKLFLHNEENYSPTKQIVSEIIDYI